MEKIIDKILLELVTPEKQLVKEEVEEITIPGELGYLGILPGHRPLLSTLGYGVLSFRKGNVKKYFAIFGGYVEVLPGRVLVFADEGEKAEDINIEKVKEEQREIDKELEKAKKGEFTPEKIEEILLRLRRVLILLEAANKRR
jgi:F-type H+-transporting ATPase subunit epsilon